jgi:diguanylate cyclase
VTAAASSPVAPAQLAKGALKRLAQTQQEPTPENYARAYAEESGQTPAALPDRVRPVLERLLARAVDDPARREEALTALMHGRWDQASAALDRGSPSAAAQAQAWASLLERVVRSIERSTRQWTPGRKKDSLQRVLDGSRGDITRLQQRVGALVGSWEQDRPSDDEAMESPDAYATQTMPLTLDTEAGVSAVETSAVRPWPSPGEADWNPVVDALHRTVGAGLPAEDVRATELADQLGRLADRLALEGPAADVVEALDVACADIRRLFGHRGQLLGQLASLCDELGAGLVELAEDDSWAQGQVQMLRSRLADGVSARGVRAASEILAETRSRQQRVREERDAAREALKHLIHRLLHELGELGEHTDRFQHNIGRHAEAIERADSLESLTSVVREMVDEGRSVQSLVRQTQARLHNEHARASELESKVRVLEGELRRLSDEVSTDALTQVANRRGLQQAFQAEAARADRGGGPDALAVALLDIDNFKKLNDTLGHAVGDEALKALAAAVRERLRPVDHLARFGGEEFVVLLPLTPLAEAQQALTRLQRSLTSALFMHENQDVFVTFSAGVTAWREGETLEAALERADEALYEAKRTGKNRTCTA